MEQIQRLFSKERLQSYENQEQHFANFFLIGNIAPAIGMLEVILRNRIDEVLSKIDSQWLYKEAPRNIGLKIDTKHTDAHQIISHQSLGFWLKIVEYYRIHNRIFAKDFLDCYTFKDYYHQNKKRFKSGTKLQNYQKVTLILRLFINLRNRVFHFENLYKLNADKKPRLSAFITNAHNEKFIVNLEPDKIMQFLYDLLKYFDTTLAQKVCGTCKAWEKSISPNTE